jgi:hypothetical protein
VTQLTITAQRGRDLICCTVTKAAANPYTAWAKTANAIDRILGRGTWTVVTGNVATADKPLRFAYGWPARCNGW